MKSLKLLFIAALCFWCLSAFSQEKMEIGGAIIIQNFDDPSPEAGTIRWTGADFEGWNGQRWVSLTRYATVGSVTDIDGNTYETTRIGNQEWMIENLRVTKYNDNTFIETTTNAAWSLISIGARCWYDNNSSYDTTYGRLYNWYAVNTGKLCPTGWHVPTDSEWTTLTDYLGGEGIAGGKMKEAGTTNWISSNTGATNESGFTGVPGGLRDNGGTFNVIGFSGNWWSSTENDTSDAWYRNLSYVSDDVGRLNRSKRYGFSVRCVRD